MRGREDGEPGRHPLSAEPDAVTHARHSLTATKSPNPSQTSCLRHRFRFAAFWESRESASLRVVSHHGITSAAALPRFGQIAPKIVADRVLWSCGAEGRVICVKTESHESISSGFGISKTPEAVQTNRATSQRHRSAGMACRRSRPNSRHANHQAGAIASVELAARHAERSSGITRGLHRRITHQAKRTRSFISPAGLSRR